MDEFGIKPSALPLERTEEEFEQVLDQETKDLAGSYHHPAWERVEDMFNEQIEALMTNPVDPQLPAEEYKILDLANKKAANTIKQIWKRVTDAVDATEGRGEQ